MTARLLLEQAMAALKPEGQNIITQQPHRSKKLSRNIINATVGALNELTSLLGRGRGQV